MKNENEKQFIKACKIIMKGRDTLTKSLGEIQKTPALDKSDVQIMSEAIDAVDRAVAKLTTSFNQKTNW